MQMSRKLGIFNTVRTRIWSWLSGKNVSCFRLFPPRSEAPKGEKLSSTPRGVQTWQTPPINPEREIEKERESRREGGREGERESAREREAHLGHTTS